MRRALLMTALVFLAARPAAAHEVVHQLVPGGAVAVRVTYADGEPLAYAEYRLFSPADTKIEHQKGRADRNGWVSFVPEPPGRWHLQVVGRDGHGLDTELEVGAGVGTTAVAPRAPLAQAVRMLAGVGALAALFGGLWLFQRRRGRRS